MVLTIQRTTKGDRVLQYGTVACTLLKDIGNATNQPYLQAIASVSLLIMETVQKVRDNKDACMKMSERAYELVCAIINICRDSEADLTPHMVRSINQFTETLEKILSFVRTQVAGSFWRRMLRAMEDADVIAECNTGLKHALDVFGVQSGIIAAMTMAEMQRDARARHDELIAILKEKRSRKARRSSTDGSAATIAGPDDGTEGKKRKKRRTSSLSPLPAACVLPASPKIFHGRAEELAHVVNTILAPAPPPSSASASASSPAAPTPARITIPGPAGIGKSALALAAAHNPAVAAHFGARRFFVECAAAEDARGVVRAIGAALGLGDAEKVGRKHVIRALGGAVPGSALRRSDSVDSDASDATAVESAGEPDPKQAAPTLLVLDGLERAWKPHVTRTDVEDFLSLLADVPALTLVVTLRGTERPRQLRWTRPFLPALHPLPAPAAHATFLDISDADPEDPDLPAVLVRAAGFPRALTALGGLASFEGCAALVRRWDAEGAAGMLHDLGLDVDVDGPALVLGGVLTEEPDAMEERVPTAAGERDVLAVLDPSACAPPSRRASLQSIESVLGLSPSRPPSPGPARTASGASPASLARLQDLHPPEPERASSTSLRRLAGLYVPGAPASASAVSLARLEELRAPVGGVGEDAGAGAGEGEGET